MKKVAAIFLTVTFLVPIFVCGCGGNDNFTAQSYASGDTPVDGLVIDVAERAIEIVAAEDGQIGIEYCESAKEYYEISVSESNILTMTLQSNKEWTDFIGTKPAAEYRKIKIAIPNGLLSSLTLKTTNETIKLSPLSVTGSVSLTVNGGDVEFAEIAVGKSLDATSKNGDITGTIVGGWDDFSIKCDVKKGESNLPADKPDGEKALRVQSNNGDVEINFVKA